MRTSLTPVARDSLSIEEITARLGEIVRHFDLARDETVARLLLAEYMQLQEELERLSDPHHRFARH